jgi:tetratricopeptide (TPR) repeat protein
MDNATRNRELEAERSLSRARELRKAGRAGEAVNELRTVLRRHPDYVGALYELGMIHIEKKDYSAALPYLVRAAMHNPKDYRISSNLAALYYELEAFDMAEHTNRFAIDLNPKSHESRFNQGKILVKQRRYEAAAHQYRRALELDKNYFDAAIRLGRCYEHLGLIGEAADIYLSSFNMPSADKRRSLYALSDLPQNLVGIDVLAEMMKLPAPRATSEKDGAIRANLLAARAFDKAGEYDKAWEHVCGVKAALRPQHEDEYDASSRFERDVLNSAGDYPVKIASAARATKVPTSLYILGPSRSGKSTLERLLIGCKGVCGGYENGVLGQAVKAANQVAGRLSSELLMRLPLSLYPTFAQFYCDALSKTVGDNRVYTTTTPALVALLPQILAAVPRAKFVFVKRDKNDTMLRIFFRRYRSGNHYAYDLAWIEQYLDWYDALIDIYCAKYPEHTMIVRYEDMVADPEPQLRRVTEFIGLELPANPDFAIGDDRGCAKPYRDLMAAEIGRAV